MRLTEHRPNLPTLLLTHLLTGVLWALVATSALGGVLALAGVGR